MSYCLPTTLLHGRDGHAAHWGNCAGTSSATKAGGTSRMSARPVTEGAAFRAQELVGSNLSCLAGRRCSFLSSADGLTTASKSARKLSNGTMELNASSGSPLALIVSRRLSRSKKPGCPTAAHHLRTPESDLPGARQRYFSRHHKLE